MKKLLVILLLSIAAPVHANNPVETLAEIARRSHSNSPTPQLQQQITDWIRQATAQSLDPIQTAYNFVAYVMPELMSSRDSQMVTEAFENPLRLPTPRSEWITSYSQMLDATIAQLTQISVWAHQNGYDERTELAQVLELFDEWLCSYIKRQKEYQATYNRCMSPVDPPDKPKFSAKVPLSRGVVKPKARRRTTSK